MCSVPAGDPIGISGDSSRGVPTRAPTGQGARRRILIAFTTCLTLLWAPWEVWAQARSGPQGEQPEGRTGAAEEAAARRDPAAARTRVDQRFKYRELGDDRYSAVATSRLDTTLPLPDGWLTALRFDMPLALTDRSGPDNPDGDDVLGAGDFLSQFFVIAPSPGATRRFRLGAGAQFIWPTASRDETGSGKYQVAPSAFGIYYTPGLGKGSFVGLILRDFVSYAGDEDRRDIHELSVQPALNVNLPGGWYLSSFPDIRINWKDDAKVFVPLNLEVGKFVGRDVLTSVQVDVPVVNDYDLYEWQVELRVGFYF